MKIIPLATRHPTVNIITPNIVNLSKEYDYEV